jgi:hypothetical protein
VVILRYAEKRKGLDGGQTTPKAISQSANKVTKGRSKEATINLTVTTRNATSRTPICSFLTKAIALKSLKSFEIISTKL